MPNFFDQFDAPSQAAPAQTAPQAQANYFDQFDAAPAQPGQDAQQPQPQQSFLDKLLGNNGPRYQLFPEKFVRGIVGDIAGATTDNSIPTSSNYTDADEALRQANDAALPSASFRLATTFSPLPAAVRAGESALPGVAMAKAKVPTPSSADLVAAAKNDYKAFDNSGLAVAPDAVSRWSNAVQQQLLRGGIHPVLADKTFQVLKGLENVPTTAPGETAQFTAPDLQALRQTLQGIAQGYNKDLPKDQLAATRAIKYLDQFLPSLAKAAPQDVLAGDATGAQSLLSRANANQSAAFRSNDLTGALDKAKTGILERAEGRTAAANSGRNFDNSLRSRVESYLEKPSEVSGLTQPEIAALNNVVQGGPIRNTLRTASNRLGGGGGLGETGIGAGVGGLAGYLSGASPEMGALIGAAAPATAGSILKSVENFMAKQAMNKADDLIRKRSPLYQDAVQNAPFITPNNAQPSLAARLALLSQLSQPSTGLGLFGFPQNNSGR